MMVPFWAKSQARVQGESLLQFARALSGGLFRACICSWRLALALLSHLMHCGWKANDLTSSFAATLATPMMSLTLAALPHPVPCHSSPCSPLPFQVVSSAIVDKYIGESARIIREMFGCVGIAHLLCCKVAAGFCCEV